MHKYYILLLLMLFALTPIIAQEQNQSLALETIARINEWRIAEGTWPLRINPILTDMAISHATYLISLDELPENLHAGATGLNPRERALLDPFKWPHYQLPEQIAVGENAGIGTLDYAMNFWEGSDIHHRTSVNPVYREIGVAALPYKDGHLFIVVFGGRPDVVPALIDPRDGQTIYLSNEVFEYAEFFNSVHSIVDIQIFNTEGQPLFDEPQPWSSVLEIPEGAGDTIYVLMSDGNREVLSRVNRETDAVIVLGSISAPEEEAEAASGATFATATPQSEVVEDQATPEATPQPTLEPTTEPTSVPASDGPDMLILYTADTLNVINVSGAPMDWQNLEIRGVINVPFTQFTKFVDLDLSAIPDRHCVQIRSHGVAGDVVKPESCNWVRSLVTVQADRIFWQAGEFELVDNGTSFATCLPANAICEIKFE